MERVPKAITEFTLSFQKLKCMLLLFSLFNDLLLFTRSRVYKIFYKSCNFNTLISLINEGLQITVGSVKKYLNLINEGSGTNGGPGIFVTLYEEAFENSHFFSIFTQFFNDFFQK